MSLLALAVSALGGETARAVFIVSPGAQATTEGNANNGFPFNIAAFGLNSQRYQQVYLASEFAGVSGPQFVTQIAFRPDAGSGGAFSATLPNIQINLSTTPRGPDGLSTTFADNVGANDTVVSSGPLTLSSAFAGPAAGPKAFDIVINLLTPFIYNPAAGNLLLDVRNFGGGRTTQIDAQNTSADPTSRAFTIMANGVNNPTGLVDSFGLVTRFDLTPVPEPSGVVLLGLGGVGLLGWLRRRGQPAV